jgi:hypothetical protein
MSIRRCPVSLAITAIIGTHSRAETGRSGGHSARQTALSDCAFSFGYCLS